MKDSNRDIYGGNINKSSKLLAYMLKQHNLSSLVSFLVMLLVLWKKILFFQSNNNSIIGYHYKAELLIYVCMWERERE